MKPDRLLQAINERKARSPNGEAALARIALFELSNLRSSEPESKVIPGDYFVLKLFTIFEVSGRDVIRQILDSKPDLLPKASKLFERGNLRIDASVAHAIQGKLVTLGELVARTIPLSEVKHLDSALSELLGTNLKDLLKSAVPARNTLLEEIGAPTGQPIDSADTRVEEILKTVAVTCEQRHVIAHEIPNRHRFELIDTELAISNFGSFLELLDIALEQLIHGSVAYSMVQMYDRERRKHEIADTKLKELIAEVIDQSNPDDEHHDLLEVTIKSWKSYRVARANLIADTWRGGSGAPMIGLTASLESTEEFIEFIRRYRRSLSPESDL